MMYQCRFIGCNKGTIPAGDVIIGEALQVCGGYMANLCTFCSILL